MLKELTILLLLFPFVSSACPGGSFEYHSNCYFYNNTEVGFGKAELNCYNLGGHLVSFHDGFTNAVIGQKFGPGSFWIGATYLITGNSLAWTDSSSFDYTEWSNGVKPPNGTTKNCVYLNTTNGNWFAQNCYNQLAFVCKVASNSSPPVNDCPERSFEYNSNCYIYNNKSLKFSEAELTCNNHGGNLVSVHDGLTNMILQQKCRSDFDEMWIGAKNLLPNKNWTWTDSSSFDFSNIENYFYVDGCLTVLHDGTWFVTDCFIPHPSLCKISKQAPTPPPSICQNGAFEYQSNCYTYSMLTYGLTNAELYCNNFGGHLISIDDPYTNIVLSQEASYIDYWIGATRLLTNGNWSWTDSSAFDYSNIYSTNTSYKCAYLLTSNGSWIADDCFQQHYFICNVPSELSSTIHISTTTPTAPTKTAKKWE